MIYEIYVTVSISEAADAEGHRTNSHNLMYSRRFTVTGERFTDLAPRIDAVMDAAETAADYLDPAAHAVAAARAAAHAARQARAVGEWEARTEQLRAAGFEVEAAARDKYRHGAL